MRGIFRAAVLLASLAACDDGPTATAIPPDLGLEALTDWESIPVIRPYVYRQYSSYERTPDDNPLIDPGNKDFNNFVTVCGHPVETIFEKVDDDRDCPFDTEGQVLVAVDGPGFISRLWTTTNGGFGDETLQFYIDGATEPAYESRVADWSEGSDEVFAEPFAGWRSGSMLSMAPVGFSSSLWIVATNLEPFKLFYYHVDVQQTDETTLPFRKQTFDGEAARRAADLLASFGENPGSGFARVVDAASFSVPAQDSTDLLDYSGAGTIELLELTLPQPTLESLQDVQLQIYWDGAGEPAVDTPLSAFFGVHLAIRDFRSLALRVQTTGEDTQLSFYLPMPFAGDARIVLVNEGAEPIAGTVSVGVDDELPREGWGHFHASYRVEEAPIPDGSLYEVLDVTGTGKYVGTFMFLEGHGDTSGPFEANPFNYLEGDEIATIDGEMRVHGTGTEDYFNGGWYFEKGEFDAPFGGLNARLVDPDEVAGATSLHRWHLLTDEINFQESFELRFEYGADKPALADRYASVAYYYLR